MRRDKLIIEEFTWLRLWRELVPGLHEPLLSQDHAPLLFFTTLVQDEDGWHPSLTFILCYVVSFSGFSPLDCHEFLLALCPFLSLLLDHLHACKNNLTCIQKESFCWRIWCSYGDELHFDIPMVGCGREWGWLICGMGEMTFAVQKSARKIGD